jgi:tRNA threonylcarbamoyladenosine dehydratase
VSQKELNRFSRSELLIGAGGIAKLNRSRVAVIGLGGVGSYAAEALARTGIGWLILADYGEISFSDTNRQLHAISGNYHRSKAEVMEERLRSINPDLTIVSWKEAVRPDNLEVILHGRISYVVDATGAIASKTALIRYCKENGIPIISALETENRLDPLAFRVDDLSRIQPCPATNLLRNTLQENGVTSGVKVVYSTEPPLNPPPETLTCGHHCGCPHRQKLAGSCPGQQYTPGSISYLPPLAGLITAGEVIRDLLKG